jgi:hypothetical protein
MPDHLRLAHASPRPARRAASRAGIALAGLAAALIPRPAAAAPASEPIVVEARTGERAGDTDRLLAPVLAELARSGFAGPPVVAGRIDRTLSRPSRRVSDEQAEGAVRAIEAGYKQFLSGRFDPAIQEIERGLAVLRVAPAALVGKNDRRDAVMRGLVGLALAHKRRGQPAQATEAMKELVRSFPDREVSYKAYGPEPREFFDAVRQDLAVDGKGSIAVDLDDDRTVVFLNERYAGTGDVKIGDLYPGTYRLFLQQQSTRFGRVHDVVVEPGAITSVSLSWQLDAAVRTEGRAALVFEDEAARRAHEARFAVRLARAVGAPSVVVLGIRQNRGRRSVVGAFYTADSTRPLRSGAVAVAPVAPGVDRFEALARLLAGDDAAAALVSPLSDDDNGSSAAAPIHGGTSDAERDHGARPLRTWRWVALGAGVAAIAGGATLLALHEPMDDLDDGDSRVDAPRTSTRGAGLATASAGAVLTGLAVYFFIRDRRDARADLGADRTTLVPLEGGGAALVVSGRF